MAAGERASVAAGADYGEYRSLKLSGRDCLMCLPANNTRVIVRKAIIDLLMQLSYKPA